MRYSLCTKDFIPGVEEADGPGASKWGRLKGDSGWISLDFVQKMR